MLDPWREALGDQIVDFVTRDSDFGEFSRSKRFLEEDFAVDVRGIGLGARNVW